MTTQQEMLAEKLIGEMKARNGMGNYRAFQMGLDVEGDKKQVGGIVRALVEMGLIQQV